jgi:hypothetical protein
VGLIFRGGRCVISICLCLPQLSERSELAIVPRHLTAAPSDLQATVQRRVTAVLTQLGGLASSATMELRRLGLGTLHQILQTSSPCLLVGYIRIAR